MKKKGNIKCIFLIICIIILLFQNYLQVIIKPFQYFDEFLAVLSIPIIIIAFAKKEEKKIKKYDLFIVLLAALLFFSGLFSSLKNRYQPLNIVFADALLVYKFFFAYMLSQLIFDSEFFENNGKTINKVTRVMIVLFFILTVSNYLFKIWPTEEKRLGIMTNKLFYLHPTYLAAACIFLLALLILTTKEKIQVIHIILIYATLLSTLRFKAIGAAIIILGILLYLENSNKKISIMKMGLLAIIAIAMAWNQISYYYIELDGSARKVLNETSIKIAKDYFPLGAGFGTFGSHYSSSYYSPIYYLYGISNIYGLEKGRTGFISDTFWPMIIGQFGIIGTVCYCLMILLIFLKIQKEYSKENKRNYISKIICLAYLLVSSTSESAFVNPIAIPLAIIIGISIKKKREEKEKNDT